MRFGSADTFRVTGSLLLFLLLVTAAFPQEIPQLPFLDERVQISSSELLDYDEQTGIFYGRARTTVKYKEFVVEADRISFDTRLREVHASGEVVFRSPRDDFRADSVRYNFELNEGVASGVSGRHEFMFFKASEDETTPSFRRLSKEEAVLRDGMFTTCDFPVPHYRVRAKEFIIILDERVFARHAILYVREFPSFYFPFYSRSLREHSPWSQLLGYQSELGYFARLGYDSWHELEEPCEFDEEEYVKQSTGHIGARLDYMSKRGLGYELWYRYRFARDRHHGWFDVYAIADDGREVGDPDKIDEETPVEALPPTEEAREEIDDETGDWRWLWRMQHYSEILKNLYLQLDIDWVSDADLYYDILDHFREEERGRLPERRGRAALTWREDWFVARILFEIKDRLSRNRISNPSEPGDDDLEYDPDPLNIGYDWTGIPKDRFGRVSKRLPHATFATRQLKLWQLPLYYDAQLDLINNLDPGLNYMDKSDDDYVRGGDLYQGVSLPLRLSDRLTLLSRVGAGISHFKRDDYDFEFPRGVTFPAIVDGLGFLDENTFLIGREERSLDDVEELYLYADIYLRLTAQLADNLQGAIRYLYRDGTDDSLPEFYESIGARHVLSDVYAFRFKQHWIEPALYYYLWQYNLAVTLSYWHNLQSNSDIFANEKLDHAFLGIDYHNQRETLQVSTGFNYERRQLRDPGDPYAFEQDELYGNFSASYVPLSERWWTSVGVYGRHKLDEDPLRGASSVPYVLFGGVPPPPPDDDDSENDSSFSEDDTEVSIGYVLGGKIGPKYTLEGMIEYNTKIEDFQRASVLLRRDLHDFVVAAMVGFRRELDYDEEDDDDGLQWEFKFSVSIKTPFAEEPIGVGGLRTLLEREREEYAFSEI